MARTLTERLVDIPTTVLIQADINSDLYDKVRAKMLRVKKTKKVTWKCIIEAALETWIDEKN